MHRLLSLIDAPWDAWPVYPGGPELAVPARPRAYGCLDLARAVAAELGLPRWWLNEQASAYVARGGDPAAPRVFDHPGLRVSAASGGHWASSTTSSKTSPRPTRRSCIACCR